jgi:hypothetical protein
MPNAPSAPLVDTEQLEELVRQFFAAAESEAGPTPDDDLFMGADISSLLEQAQDYESDPIFAAVTQRAMLNISISEVEIDHKLHDGPQ